MIDEVCSKMTDDKLASGNDNKQAVRMNLR